MTHDRELGYLGLQSAGVDKTMYADARKEYLAHEVLAAPPQKRHLMLVEAAIRHCLAALRQWEGGGDQTDVALKLIGRARQLLGEILGGLQPQIAPELASRAGALYLWAYKRLALAGLQLNSQYVRDALRVLQQERETWRQLCRASEAGTLDASASDNLRSDNVEQRR